METGTEEDRELRVGECVDIAEEQIGVKATFKSIDVILVREGQTDVHAVTTEVTPLASQRTVTCLRDVVKNEIKGIRSLPSMLTRAGRS